MRANHILFDQLVKYCSSHLRFNSGVFVADDHGFNCVKGFLRYDSDGWVSTVRIVEREGLYTAYFTDTESSIFVMKMDCPYSSLPRTNFMMIEEKIDDEIKNTCIYPWLTLPTIQLEPIDCIDCFDGHDLNPHPISHLEFSV